MNQYHSFYVNWFHVFMQLYVKFWNLSLTTIEFSSQNPFNSLPNLLSKSPLTNPQMHPSLLQNSPQMYPPNHSPRDPYMHPLFWALKRAPKSALQITHLQRPPNAPLFSPQTVLKCTPWSSQICPNSTLQEASKCILFLQQEHHKN